MNTFVRALSAAASPMAVTENGAIARSTTGSAVLDLFSQIGGLRENQSRCYQLVSHALAEDADLTARCVFYSRDIRGGQGERQTFRTNMRALIELDVRFKQLIRLIPEYGRWDDVVDLLDVAPQESLELIFDQFCQDYNRGKLADHPSLLAKWLPSENTSSKVSRASAKVVREYLNMSPKAYRLALSALRKKIDVVETKMSARQFSSINYSGVPGNAMRLYRHAFSNRDPLRFGEYIASVEAGESKINASTLFPYDLVRVYASALGRTSPVDAVVEAQWNALPDYFNGKKENSLVVCDVSGSMVGLPMDVCVSLGIYIAERNTGLWHNKFMTFSDRPTIQNIVGVSLRDRVANLTRSEWEMNTNIKAVFDAILTAATASGMPPAEMVTRIYIISDMEFDACVTYDGNAGVSQTLFQGIRAKFADAGYEMPQLVFWNVSSRSNQHPMALDERGFINVSGCSPSIFKYVLDQEFVSAYDMMLYVLNSDRYNNISVSRSDASTSG